MRVELGRVAAAGDQPLAPVYLLFGSELLLLEEAADQVRRVAQAQGYSERQSFQVEKGFNWQELVDSCQSLSLFAERRLIELRMPGKPGQPGSNVLAELAGDLPPDTVLLLVCGALDKATQKQKWFTALEQAGVSAEARAVTARELPNWLAGRLRDRGLHADRDSISLLVHYFEGNLLAAAQEIDRLALATGEQRIDPARQLELLQQSVSDNSRFSVFNYIDACVAGDCQRTVRALDGLRAEGDNAVYVIVMLSRELRNLAQMAFAMGRGARATDVFRTYRVWSSRQGPVGQALKRHDSDAWQSFLQQAAYLDRVAKGRAAGIGKTVWPDIEKLSLQICGLMDRDHDYARH